jgi:predicted SnoaL-like aldol condensation-catalyzing enzyme
MKNLSLGFILLFTLLLAACEKDAESNPDPVDVVVSNKEKATELLMSLATGDTSKAFKYIDANAYKQHKPTRADGRQALIDAMLAGEFNNTTVEVVRIIEDSDLVALHSEYNLNGAPTAGFDVFRFKDGLIVEHWDNLQPLEAANESGHTMLDGATATENINDTESNRTLVNQFIGTVMIESNFDAMADFVNEVEFVQHNPMMKDSLGSMIEMMEQLANQGITYQYEVLHQTIAHGNFVLTLTEGAFGDTARPTAFYDLFRLVDGKIVEHWDVMQTIPPAEEWLNDNGKF